MKFRSRNPSDQYIAFKYHHLTVFLDDKDNRQETIIHAQSFCEKFGYNQTSGVGKAIYFVRGHVRQCDYSEVLTAVLEANSLPRELWEIIHCVTFWNQEGRICYSWPQNQKENLSYPDFILHCIAADCGVFVELCQEKFITGRSGSHVWVNERKTGKRILIIHFNKVTINQ